MGFIDRLRRSNSNTSLTSHRSQSSNHNNMTSETPLQGTGPLSAAYQSYQEYQQQQQQQQQNHKQKQKQHKQPSNNNNHNNRRRESSTTAVDPLAPVNNNNNNATTALSSSSSSAIINPSIAFRGFNTPISHMFQEDRYEGIDSCSWICCGLLQSDYNRYVAQGITPPSWHRRCHLHLIIPLLVFWMAVYCAVHIRDEYLNEVITTALVVLLCLYWMTQCCKGRAKRVAVRKELLTLKYYHTMAHHRDDQEEDDEEEDEDDDDDDKVYRRLGQTSCDLQCAHSLLGCYATDVNRNNVALIESTQRGQDNVCSCLWRTLYGIFGCSYCGCSLQWCGICATAQEGRDLLHSSSATTSTMFANGNSGNANTPSSFIPWHVTFVDYITFQPMLDYYPRIYRLRHETSNRSWLCYHLCCSLSKLSKWILSWAFLFLSVLLVWSLLTFVFPQHHAFHWPNYLVMLATFGYGMIVLYFIHALWHMLDLSVDAVIKYYMSGFCLATSMAIVGEICLSLLIRFATDIMLAMSGIDVVPDSGYGGTQNYFHNRTQYVTTADHRRQSRLSLSSHWWRANGSLLSHVLFASSSSSQSSSGSQQSKQPTHHDYLVAFGYAHPIFYTLYAALNAFIVAALVEEVCKYLGYRMVTHPDWSSRSDLEQVQQDLLMQERLMEQHRQQHRNQTRRGRDQDEYDEEEGEYDDDDDVDIDEDDDGNSSRSSSHQGRGRKSDKNRRKKKKNERRRSRGGAPGVPPAMDRGTLFARKHARNNAANNAAEDPLEFSLQDRTYTSRGAAVTVAMIAVAVGFSCCENLVYIFLYAGAGASASASIQWAVLLARSLFPVHVISAALQSIGVVRRDIEQRESGAHTLDGEESANPEKKIRLGRILWPAILFHGSYDFFIIWIEFLANRRRTLLNSSDNAAQGGDGSNGGSSTNESSAAAIASLVVSVILEVAALIYYVWASHAQRKRLRAMDGAPTSASNHSNGGSNVDPSSLL